jgi:hypothetical protein
MANETQELQADVVEKQEVEVVEGAERTRPVKAFIPKADIYETDMPGVD